MTPSPVNWLMVPSYLMDLIHEDLEAPVHDPVDLLRVELLGHGGVVGDIGEEDRDELALPFHGTPGGEDLVGQELRGVGVRLRE